MSHHSAQDIAAMSAIPNMRVYLPSDRFQTAELVRALVADNKPAYIRVGRNPVEDVYTEGECPFQMDRATWVRRGADVTIVATARWSAMPWTPPTCWPSRASRQRCSTCTASSRSIPRP